MMGSLLVVLEHGGSARGSLLFSAAALAHMPLDEIATSPVGLISVRLVVRFGALVFNGFDAD